MGGIGYFPITTAENEDSYMKPISKTFTMKSIRHNHALLMILGCIVTIALVLVLSWTGIIGSSVYFLLILLCPLMHVFMHKGLHYAPSIPDDNKP